MVKVYINGEYIKQYNLATYTSLATPVRMGASSDGSNYQFNGSIQNTAIYTRAFSAEEVKQLYNDNKPKMQSSSLEKGLVGHWPLDGENYNASDNRVTDKSAYSNHGTNYGATLTGDRFGKDDGAMSFDGASWIITNTNSEITNFNGKDKPFSFSFWAKADNRVGLFDGFINFRGITDNYSGIILSFSNSDTNLRIRYWQDGGTNLSWENNNIIGNWSFFSVVVNNNLIEVYQNGLKIKSGSFINPFSFNGKIDIGRYLYNNNNLNGSISDVRIYNRALSNDEVEQLYTNYKPKVSANSLNKGLILDMPLTSKYTKSETAGSEIMTDNTPYSHDGQNHGAVISDDMTSFDGVNDYIESNKNIASTGLSPRTINVWFMPEVMQTQNLLGYGSQSTGKLFDIYLSVNGQIGGHFYNGGYDTMGIDSPMYILNTWQNFTIVYDGVNAYIYFNGQYYKRKTINLNTGDSKLVIGKGIWTSPANFKGKISNVKIYDRVLSTDEVKSLYDQGRGNSGTILNGLE